MTTSHFNARLVSPSLTDASQSDEVTEAGHLAVGGRPYDAARPRSSSNTGSVAFSPRTPARSFYHRSFHGSLGKVAQDNAESHTGSDYDL